VSDFEDTVLNMMDDLAGNQKAEPDPFNVPVLVERAMQERWPTFVIANDHGVPRAVLFRIPNSAAVEGVGS